MPRTLCKSFTSRNLLRRDENTTPPGISDFQILLRFLDFRKAIPEFMGRDFRRFPWRSSLEVFPGVISVEHGHVVTMTCCKCSKVDLVGGFPSFRATFSPLGFGPLGEAGHQTLPAPFISG